MNLNGIRARGHWVLLVAAVAGCDRDTPGRVPASPEPVAVRVSQVVASSGGVSVPATVRSTEEAEVSTRVSGVIRQVRVEVGSHVRKGETLLVIDDDDLRAAVRRAGAEAERAAAYHRRIESLQADGAATAQELDDARAALEAAEGAVEAARAQRAYAVLTAPFPGVVAERRVDPGDLAVPGMPLLRIVRPGSLKVEAEAPRGVAEFIDIDDDAVVESAGRMWPARVRRIAPALDRESHRMRIELSLEDGGDLPNPPPGALARVIFEGMGEPTLRVPADAVIRRGQLAGVLVVTGDRLRLRWIRAGFERLEGDSSSVEVLSGVSAGEDVVRRPSPDWLDGTPVSRVDRVPWNPR